MAESGSIQNLDEAMKAFKANPNTKAQMVLERAMRVYQSNVTAVEPVSGIDPQDNESEYWAYKGHHAIR